MKKITKKRVYRDLMAMDGARMRDLNVASKLDLAGATVGPIAATTGKVIGATFVIGGFVLSTISCKNDDPETPIPPCLCNPKNHLGIDEKKKCGGIGCTCSEWTDTLDGITIRKQKGITNPQAGATVVKIDLAYQTLTELQKPTFATKVNEIHIVNGNVSNYDSVEKVLYVGRGTNVDDLSDVMLDDIVLVALFKQFDNSKDVVRMAMFYFSNSKII